jgi:streptomycin 6-kinase
MFVVTEENTMVASNALNHYLDFWQLADPQPLAETPTSQVYTVTYDGVRVVLKLLTPIGAKDEGQGALALQHFNGKGAVRLFRHDDAAHLLEYVDGPDLVDMVRNGDDDQATAITADVLNQLHAAPRESMPTTLIPLPIRFRDLFKRADEESHMGSASIYVRGAAMARRLFDQPRDVCVLHGDIHHENIRYKAGRGWLAFDPKGLIGERTYDAANTFCNPIKVAAVAQDESQILRRAEIFSQRLGIDAQRILQFAFAYTCLSAIWWLDVGKVPGHELKIAALIEPHTGG